MRPSEVLPQHREAIRQMVLDSGMANPRLFGSVLHGDDAEDSDLDLLVDPSPETSLLDLAKLQVKLRLQWASKLTCARQGFCPQLSVDKVLAEAMPV